MTSTINDSNHSVTATADQVPTFFAGNHTQPVVKTSAEQKNESKKEKVSMSRLNPQDRKKKKMPWWSWILIIIGALLVITISALAVLGISYKDSLFNFKVQAQETYQLALDTYTTFKNQDLPGTDVKLQATKASLDKTTQQFQELKSPLTLIGRKAQYEDGLAALAAAQSGLTAAQKGLAVITPYADVLGFTVEKKEEGGTAEDRIKKLLDTVSVVGPELDSILVDLKAAQAQIATIDPNDYPEKLSDWFGVSFALNKIGQSQLANFPARNKIVELKDTIDLLIKTFEEYQPVINKLPEIAGSGEGNRKKYLVIFQNNNELRPTGGFLTAYAVIYMENGKITTEKSDDIYELDKKFTKKIAIPATLGKYLTTEKYWNLRDMNIDPDFANSMETFLENYQTVSGEPQDIDGIITIDTRVLTDLIDILGPVEVAGYGTFSTELDKKYNAPQIIIALSEIITRPTPYMREDRKGILGPMMSAILTKVYSAQKEQFPALFQMIVKNIEGRHVQAYFLNEELQSAADKISLTGKMIAPTDGSDFLAIVDANLGGAKSNLFIDYDVTQTVLPPENGELTKQVVINYKNSQPGDNCNLEAGLLCLNSTNNDWNRIYLPLGSKLIGAKGYKNEPSVYDENGFTVIDGYFSLNPDSTAKITLDYTVPYTNATDYTLNIWQQGGLRTVKHLLDVNDNQEEIEVAGDTLYKAKF